MVWLPASASIEFYPHHARVFLIWATFLWRWPILRDPQQVTTIEKADISNKDTNGLCFKCSVKEICLSFGAFTLKELCFLFSVLLPSSSGSTHPQVTSSLIMPFEISVLLQTWYSKHILSHCEESQMHFSCSLRLCYTTIWPICDGAAAAAISKEEWCFL